jgi:ATP-dependent DNA helicase RecQ
MAYLQQALDDPDPARCGRCSVCTGELPHPGLQPTRERIVAAQAHLRGVDLVIEPRKLWPSGVGRSGRITGIAEGRAMAFADDPAWADELAAFERHGARELGPDLLAGAVEVLRRWARAWPGRPVAVVPAPAPGVEAQTNRQLAEHIGAVGKLPVLEVLSWQGAAPPGDSSSGPIVAHLERALQFDEGASLPDGPVLLCATTMRTGWTLTLSAALLHDRGVSAVMPLVLHRLP